VGESGGVQRTSKVPWQTDLEKSGNWIWESLDAKGGPNKGKRGDGNKEERPMWGE